MKLNRLAEDACKMLKSARNSIGLHDKLRLESSCQNDKGIKLNVMQ